MTEERIKDYVSKNCCGLCDNRKWCSIQNECFVVNAITEATKELEGQIEKMKCCVNCKHLIGMSGEHACWDCKDLSNWKLKEIKEK